jgi:hypothetical protein
MLKSNNILAILIAGIMLATGLSAPAAACGASEAGTPTRPPAIGATIDAFLPTAVLADDVHAHVLDLRAQIVTLVASGQLVEARQRENEGMLLLGYRRASSHCGPGARVIWGRIKTSSGN